MRHSLFFLGSNSVNAERSAVLRFLIAPNANRGVVTLVDSHGREDAIDGVSRHEWNGFVKATGKHLLPLGPHTLINPRAVRAVLAPQRPRQIHVSVLLHGNACDIYFPGEKEAKSAHSDYCAASVLAGIAFQS